MAEKIKKVEQSNLKPDTAGNQWVDDAITNLQKEHVLSNEEAALVLYGQTLRSLKDLVAGNQNVLSVYEDNLEGKVARTIELAMIVSQILGNSGVEELKRAAGSNKFRPAKISIDQADVLRQKATYVEATGGRIMKDPEANEVASCKKIIDVLLTRLFINDGAQELADIANLMKTHPEMAADLGKIIQATEILSRHNKHLERIKARDIERKEYVARAKGQAAEKANEPVLYAEELFGGTKYSVEEPKRLFGGFHQRVKELEKKAERDEFAITGTIN